MHLEDSDGLFSTVVGKKRRAIKNKRDNSQIVLMNKFEGLLIQNLTQTSIVEKEKGITRLPNGRYGYGSSLLTDMYVALQKEGRRPFEWNLSCYRNS